MKTLDEHNSEVIGRYARSDSSGNDIACPDCGCELIDTDPMTTLTSNPPQMYIHCPKCGYTGTRYC